MSKKPFRILEEQTMDTDSGSPNTLEANQMDAQRGVANPKVIDLISFNLTTARVELLIVEDRQYPDLQQGLVELYEQDRTLLLQLEEKLNSYLSYILDGFLADHYPQYKGKPVTIVFEHSYPLSSTALDFLKAFSTYISHNTNIKFISTPSNCEHH
jgi:hypothetical protein